MVAAQPLNEDDYDVAIVGGGAAGMCAALGAANAARDAGQPLRIAIIERNPRLGIKILISGGGKCNITHSGPVEEVLRLGFLQPKERRFLKHSFYRFTNTDVLELLDRHGVTWHTRENGRVFPDSSRAEDVLRAFESELHTYDVTLLCGSRVIEIASHESGWEIRCDRVTLRATTCIVTTGGISYPKVGTTGDGIRFGRTSGHEIVPLRAALAPIHLDPLPATALQGVPIRAATLLAESNGKVISSREGDLLFTHKGVSGPAVLDISRDVALALESSAVELYVKLIATDESQVRERVLSEQSARSQQMISTWLEEILPNRLVPYVLHAAMIEQERRWNKLTKEERQRLIGALLRYPLGRVADVPIDRGEVTAGGIDLASVDPKTMRSRHQPGLYFAGEVLDIAGEIGGYNLQAAYSTGWVAGESAASNVLRSGDRDE